MDTAHIWKPFFSAADRIGKKLLSPHLSIFSVRLFGAADISIKLKYAVDFMQDCVV